MQIQIVLYKKHNIKKNSLSSFDKKKILHPKFSVINFFTDSMLQKKKYNSLHKY